MTEIIVDLKNKRIFVFQKIKCNYGETFLQNIVNQILKTGIFPDDMEQTKIIHFHSKADQNVT